MKIRDRRLTWTISVLESGRWLRGRRVGERHPAINPARRYDIFEAVIMNHLVLAAREQLGDARAVAIVS